MRPFCHLPLHFQWLFKMLNYFVHSYTLIIEWKSATQEQLVVFYLAQHQVHLLVHLYIYKYWSLPLVATPGVLSGAPWTVSSNAPQTHLLFFRLHSHSYHETVIRTGIRCKKIPCYMCDSACRWFIVKKAKIFEVMLNIFEFLLVWENVESWLVFGNKLFCIAQTYFSTNIIKQS